MIGPELWIDKTNILLATEENWSVCRIHSTKSGYQIEQPPPPPQKKKTKTKQNKTKQNKKQKQKPEWKEGRFLKNWTNMQMSILN